jgi:tRNA/rRNA methyltransferase
VTGTTTFTCPPPIVVLVAPQMGENIGAAARAMGNFGLQELRIVSPRDGWPNPAALSVAAHALPIIENAGIYTTLAEALTDCHFVYATCAFLRDMRKPVTTPQQINWPAGGKTALLFGRENHGLSNEEIAHAQQVVTIPVHPQCPSLNVAQAVAILAYEWFKTAPQQMLQQMPPSGIPATQTEVQGFFTQLESALDAENFWKEPNKKTRMWQNLRSLFHRAQPSTQEIQTLRGMLRALTKSG